MSNKNKKRDGIVFSTDPGYSYQEFEENEDTTLDPSDQKLRVMLERKGRGGKDVTIVHNFIGSQDDKENLTKSLKTFCGTGGTAKDGEIVIQGDQRDKVVKYLLDKGYKHTKRGN
ncbi:MAG: translation initiation factor [Bacteroidota bacterium]|nr:translation initiation factor [Bacteroidota bacterium]MDX5430259.1 translation initiation factor [Bacteroidota bacterium]MDX5469020.1 translation initiation factor [Bacteroidota bacterium]